MYSAEVPLMFAVLILGIGAIFTIVIFVSHLLIRWLMRFTDLTDFQYLSISQFILLSCVALMGLIPPSDVGNPTFDSLPEQLISLAMPLGYIVSIFYYYLAMRLYEYFDTDLDELNNKLLRMKE